MNIFTEVTIYPCASGFGIYQRGELSTGSETSYAFESDLLEIIRQNSDEVAEIGEAITSPAFLALGVQDIRGKIYNQPDKVFARIDRGDLSYFGIVESEVADDFF